MSIELSEGVKGEEFKTRIMDSGGLFLRIEEWKPNDKGEWAWRLWGLTLRTTAKRIWRTSIVEV